jgi:sec-independent protein translocase protein TatA
MGLDNPLHIAFLVVILLLVFGAKRLPEIGRSLGSGMREFKDSISGEANRPAIGPTAPPLGQAVQQPPAAAAATPPPTPAPQAAAEAFGAGTGAEQPAPVEPTHQQ